MNDDIEIQEENDVGKTNVDAVSVENLFNSDIKYDTLPTPLDTIISRLEAGRYLIPKYQRNYVWSEKQTVALIVSLLKNIPIPRIYMYSNPIDGKYTIIDGQQRITSLFLFIKGVYPISKERNFYYDFDRISKLVEDIKSDSQEMRDDAVQELEKEYGLKAHTFYLDESQENIFNFESFSPKQQLEFYNKALDFAVVSVKGDNGDNPDKDMFKIYTDIFRLLNSAGSSLTSQEIRNGVYYGSYLYKSLNNFHSDNKVWASIKKAEDNRHRNLEFLLRLLSLDKYITVIDRDSLVQYAAGLDDINAFTLDDVSNFISLEKYTTYSTLIDKYSKEFTTQKTSHETIDKEISKLVIFMDGIEDVPDDHSSLNILNIEAFYLSTSILGLLDNDFKIHYSIISESLSIDNKTSNKREVFWRIIQCIKILTLRLDPNIKIVSPRLEPRQGNLFNQSGIIDEL